jgi:pyruvate/2-oxoglutarate/acetoin dehydrogenase E1 component
MTPKEYEECWKVFMDNDDPMIVSEHRSSFANAAEIPDIIQDSADVTIYAISAARFNVGEAAEILAKKGLKCNIVNIVWLKPFTLTEKLLEPLRKSKIGIVVDSGFETAGASQSIAYELMFKTNVPVKALGICDRSVGVTVESENLTPDGRKIAEIVQKIYEEKTRERTEDL